MLIYSASIFVFYLLSGWLYGIELPLYISSTNLQGIENLFYIAAVILSFFMYKKQRESVLIAGILSIILSTTIFTASKLILMHIGIFLLQMGYGFVDAFFMMYLVSLEDTTAAIGIGMGITTLSIGLGTALFKYIPVNPLRSNGFLLALIFLVLFIMITGKQKPYSEEFEQLSDRERDVARKLLEGKKLKEIAEELHLSESSVKTYLGRVYKKHGVKTKAEFLKKIRNSQR